MFGDRKDAAIKVAMRLCITKTQSSGFPSNVTLLLPGRLLNPASSSLPHVADFNGIRHRWDLRDPQKGKRLGRPHIVVDVRKVAMLREQGRSWPQIAKQLGVGVGTACRAHQELSKNLETESLSRIPIPAVVAAD